MYHVSRILQVFFLQDIERLVLKKLKRTLIFFSPPRIDPYQGQRNRRCRCSRLLPCLQPNRFHHKRGELPAEYKAAGRYDPEKCPGNEDSAGCTG